MVGRRGQRARPVARRDSPVIVHDPDADKPKNLDDPFQDPKVQERVAKLISQAAAAPRMKPGED